MSNIAFTIDVSSTGRKQVNGFNIYPDTKIFAAGTYNDKIAYGKPLTFTPNSLKSIAGNFSDVVSGNIQHTKFLAGRALHLMNVWTEGPELHAQIAVPTWLDDNLIDDERKISVELDDRTFDKIIGVALCTNPRIKDAFLNTANEFARQKPFETPDGQSGLQMVHDIASSHGAICGPPTSSDAGNMTSPSEAAAYQQMHDIAVAGGAQCRYGSYYTEDSDLSEKDNMFTPQNVIEMLKELIPFVRGSAATNEIESTTVAASIKPANFTDTEEYKNLKAELDEVREKLSTATKTASDAEKAIADERAAKFTQENEAAVDKLIAEGRFDPKDRKMLLESRSAGAVTFDAMAQMIDVKPEYKTKEHTIDASVVAAAVSDPEKAAKLKKLETDRIALMSSARVSL